MQHSSSAPQQNLLNDEPSSIFGMEAEQVKPKQSGNASPMGENNHTPFVTEERRRIGVPKVPSMTQICEVEQN